MVETVTAECAEELSEAVVPWQVTLRQVAPGALDPQITATALDDIIVTNDRWRGYVHGYGGTPAGFVTLCGVAEPRQIHWNGHVFDDVALPIASGSSEWEFHTPHGTNHWVIMIPEHTLADRMGLHPAVISSLGTRLLQFQPQQFQRLNTLAWRNLGQPTQTGADVAERLQSQARENILDVVTELFGGVVGEDSRITARGRLAGYRRAIRHIEKSPNTANPASTAVAAGVSVRVLQLAFREHLGMSPQRYIRLCQLNLLHAMLHAAHAAHADNADNADNADRASVTTLMQESGFSEFGRVAGQYRKLFGELPSQTLGRRA